jgi:DNA-binding CsgD family transcriptional regulator
MVAAAQHLAGERQQRGVVAVVNRVEGTRRIGAKGADQVVIRASHGRILDPCGEARYATTVCDVHTRMPDPLAPHTATPEELRARIDAERAGAPFLVLRDGDAAQRIVGLDDGQPRLSIGRNPSNDVSLPWDEEVSRLHVELECIGGEWTISDDGLSRNGTFVNGARIAGRVRLRDGDVIRAGSTTIAYRRPSAAELSSPTNVGAPRLTRDDLPAMQRQVLVALARPYKHDEFAAPASNGQIAQELHLSVDAVKAHLRALFRRFGIEGLPPNQKRSRLAAEALQSGIVSQRDL